MAKSISICDTHRLPYFNGTLTAYKIGTTTPIKFKHGHNGTPQYDTLKTNARGYICDTDGTILNRGIFVAEDALIKLSLGDGVSINWEVCADNDIIVGAGRLLGKRTKDSSDTDLVEKWNANSQDDYVLDYDDLIHKPRVNEWMEVEQIVTLEANAASAQGDIVEVNKYAKTMSVQPGDVHPDGWSYLGGTWVCTDPVNANGNWSLRITPAAERVAQVVFVRNLTPWRLAIKDGTGNVLMVLDAYEGVGYAKPVVLYGNDADPQFKVGLDDDRLGFAHSVVFNSMAINNAFSPLKLNDYTPNVLMVQFTTDYTGDSKKLYLRSDVLKNRRLVLWIQNLNNTAVEVHCVNDGNDVLVGIIENYSTSEIIVNPNGIVPLNSFLPIVTASTRQEEPASTDVSPSATVKPETDTLILESTNGYTINLDSYTKKTLFVYITNTDSSAHSLVVNVDNQFKQQVTVAVDSNPQKFVILKNGNDTIVVVEHS